VIPERLVQLAFLLKVMDGLCPESCSTVSPFTGSLEPETETMEEASTIASDTSDSQAKFFERLLLLGLCRLDRIALLIFAAALRSRHVFGCEVFHMHLGRCSGLLL
jgi:hypothetical protein